MKLSAQIQLQHLTEPSGLPSVLLSSWDADGHSGSCIPQPRTPAGRSRGSSRICALCPVAPSRTHVHGSGRGLTCGPWDGFLVHVAEFHTPLPPNQQNCSKHPYVRELF